MCCKVLRCTSDVKINAKHEFHACFYAWWYGKNSLFCPFFSQIYLISCNIFFSFFSYFSSIFFSEKRKNIFFGKKEKENFPWIVYFFKRSQLKVEETRTIINISFESMTFSESPVSLALIFNRPNGKGVGLQTSKRVGSRSDDKSGDFGAVPLPMLVVDRKQG